METRPCVNFDTCPLRTLGQQCRQDVHHNYWPRKAYQTPLEREFRDLDTNKVEICVAEHRELHATQGSPEKPNHEEMFQAVSRAAIQETLYE